MDVDDTPGLSMRWLPGMHDGHSLAGLRSAVLGLSLVLFTAGRAESK